MYTLNITKIINKMHQLRYSNICKITYLMFVIDLLQTTNKKKTTGKGGN